MNWYQKFSQEIVEQNRENYPDYMGIGHSNYRSRTPKRKEEMWIYRDNKIISVPA